MREVWAEGRCVAKGWSHNFWWCAWSWMIRPRSMIQLVPLLLQSLQQKDWALAGEREIIVLLFLLLLISRLCFVCRLSHFDRPGLQSPPVCAAFRAWVPFKLCGTKWTAIDTNQQRHAKPVSLQRARGKNGGSECERAWRTGSLCFSSKSKKKTGYT